MEKEIYLILKVSEANNLILNPDIYSLLITHPYCNEVSKFVS